MHGARGMVITVEIKHHQLWGFSTFHSVPLSLSLPESPFSSRSNSNDPRCHSLRFSALPPYFFPLFSTLSRSSTSTCLSLPSHLFSFNFFSASLHPLTLSIFALFFLSFAVDPFIPNPLVKITLFPILCAPPTLVCRHKWPHKTNDPHHCTSGM